MPVPGDAYRVSSLAKDTRLRVATLVVSAIILSLAAAFAIRLLAKPYLTERNVLEVSPSLHGEAPLSPAANHPLPILELNIDGVSIVVPPHRLIIIGTGNDHNQVALDAGSGMPQGPTFDGAAHAFNLLLPWPDRSPGAPPAGQVEQDGHIGPGKQPWLMIGLAPFHDLEAPGRTPGFGPVLRERIQRPAGVFAMGGAPGDPNRPRAGIEEPSPHYATRGTDPTTGLEWAEPVGPGTGRVHAWDNVLYWQSDDAPATGARRVTDLIECYRIPDPDRHQNCTLDFYLPEWGAKLAVTFPRDRLPQWQEIKTRVSELILRFEADPALPGHMRKAATARETGCGDRKGVREMPSMACAGDGRYPKDVCCHG